MAVLNWKTNRDDQVLIEEIVERARQMGIPPRRVGRPMPGPFFVDLVACHLNGTPIDLGKLLNAPDFDFAHDVTGIMANINRETGKLDNCFLPRCAAHGKAPGAKVEG